MLRTMLTAIDFNCEHSLQTNKINYVIAKWMLTAEFETQHLLSP